MFPETLPRTAFTYWHQGFDNAPPIIRSCVAQLKRWHPDWTIHTLDESSTKDVVERIPLSDTRFSQLGLAHQSDLIRTQLLVENGGVWIDPTVFVTQSFNDWVPSRMKSGLFLFSRPGRDRLISNWFIIATPAHPLLSRLLEALCEYWGNNDFRNYGRKLSESEVLLSRLVNRNLTLPGLWFSWPFRKLIQIYPYMVYHYLYAHLVRTDTELGNYHSNMPYVSADGPHRLQRFGLLKKFDDEAENILNDPELPLHKLTWKLPSSSVGESTVLHHLECMASP